MPALLAAAVVAVSLGACGYDSPLGKPEESGSSSGSGSAGGSAGGSMGGRHLTDSLLVFTIITQEVNYAYDTTKERPVTFQVVAETASRKMFSHLPGAAQQAP